MFQNAIIKYISVNIGYKIKTYFERSKPFTFTFYRFISCVWSPRLFTVRGFRFRLVLARHCFIHYNAPRFFRGIQNKTNPPYVPPSYQRSFSRRFAGERFRRLFWRYWNAVDIVTVKSISYGFLGLKVNEKTFVTVLPICVRKQILFY